MKMKSLADDDFVTSWLAAESVSCLKEKPNFDRKEIRTKLHKIIYLVADEHNIPITRGWYMHGPFVYNNNVLNIDYKKNLRIWTSKSFKINNYFKEIKKYEFDIDEIRISIDKIVNIISKYSADEYIYKLYNEYSPKKYRQLYLQKYNLTGVRTHINAILNYFNNKFKIDRSHEPLWYLDKLLKDVDDFEIVSYNTFDDEKIEDISTIFFDVFRDTLWKCELILEEKSLNRNIIKGIYSGQLFFDNSIWSSYSGNIIKDTAKGVKKQNAQSMGRRTRANCIKKFPEEILRYDQSRKKLGLVLSYSDMKSHKRRKEFSELDKKLFDLVKITARS